MKDEFEVWHEVFRGNEFLTVFVTYVAPIDVPESSFPGGSKAALSRDASC